MKPILLGLLTVEQILTALDDTAQSVRTMNMSLSAPNVVSMVRDQLRHQEKQARKAVQSAESRDIGPSPRQLDCLRAIRELTAESGYPPTVRELCDQLHLSSSSTVHYHLQDLREKGLADWVDGQVRTLRLTEAGTQALEADDRKKGAA